MGDHFGRIISEKINSMNKFDFGWKWLKNRKKKKKEIDQMLNFIIFKKIKR